LPRLSDEPVQVERSLHPSTSRVMPVVVVVSHLRVAAVAVVVVPALEARQRQLPVPVVVRRLVVA